MAGCCVLHVCGESFDPAPFLGSVSLAPYASFRKGDRQFPGSVRCADRVHEFGGFKCLVSDRDAKDLPGQIDDAILFLQKYGEDLARLEFEKDVERKGLDFGYDCRLEMENVAVQIEYLPPELLKLCGDLDLGIMLSLYPLFCPDEE